MYILWFTYEDGFASDGSVLGLDIEFSTLADFLAFFFLFAILKAKLFNFLPHKLYSFSCIFQSIFHAGVLTLNFYHHFDVILIDFYLMLNEEGEGNGLCAENGGREEDD